MTRIRFHGTLGKFTRRMLAVVLVGQGLSISFGALVARALSASAADGRDGQWLWAGMGLAVLCIATAGLLRQPWGVTLGWVCQALTLASAVVVPMMLVVGLIFLGLWILCLVQGERLDHAVAEHEGTAR